MAHSVPPPRMDLDRERGGVGRVADGDPAFVVGQVVDAVGDGLAGAQVPVDEVVGLGSWAAVRVPSATPLAQSLTSSFSASTAITGLVVIR